MKIDKNTGYLCKFYNLEGGGEDGFKKVGYFSYLGYDVWSIKVCIMNMECILRQFSKKNLNIQILP